MMKKFFIILQSLLLVALVGGCATTPVSKEAMGPPRAILEDAVIAKHITRYGTTADYKDETSVFTSDDQQALLWVKVGDLAGRHQFRWEWYDPKGNLYTTSGDYDVNKDGKQRGYNTSWHSILIKDEKAAGLHGKWAAKFFIDDKLVTTKNFEIRKLDEFRNIAKGPKAQPDSHKWALVIGIEKYKNTAAVQFAESDAIDTKNYFIYRIGVPEENIFTLLNENASKAAIEVVVKDRLKGLTQEGDTVYVYYAGHGIPSDATPYLLPYDGDADSPAITAYPVDALYSDLDKLSAKNVFVFMDTCFSGRSGREEKDTFLLAGARPGVLKVRDPLLVSDKIVAFTAAKSNQLSNFYQEEGHGLFTYYLLKGLMGDADSKGDGTIRVKELAQYVEEHVGSESRKLFGISRQQNPVAMPMPLADKETLVIGSVVN
jgi:hypothetical protein